MSIRIRFLPEGREAQVRPGTTVMDASRKAGVHIRSRCAGKAACLMCKVQVSDQSGLSPLSEMERRKLAGLDEQGIRLSCQARVTGPVEVEVPEDPLRAAVRKQLEKQAEMDELW